MPWLAASSASSPGGDFDAAFSIVAILATASFKITDLCSALRYYPYLRHALNDDDLAILTVVDDEVAVDWIEATTDLSKQLLLLSTGTVVLADR
jgi:hypothetical protein